MDDDSHPCQPRWLFQIQPVAEHDLFHAALESFLSRQQISILGSHVFNHYIAIFDVQIKSKAITGCCDFVYYWILLLALGKVQISSMFSFIVSHDSLLLVLHVLQSCQPGRVDALFVSACFAYCLSFDECANHVHQICLNQTYDSNKQLFKQMRKSWSRRLTGLCTICRIISSHLISSLVLVSS